MNGQKVLGIIFSNMHDEVLNQLTDMRTMGSVPFCARYRLIDFPLSAMVGSGMTKVGIVTKANYQSLMDHIGTGKPWDLSRKHDGMFLLPPFNSANNSYSISRVDALYNNRNFIRQSKQEYVLITDCNVVTSLDYADLFAYQEKENADIVIVATKGPCPKNLESVLVFDKVDKSTGRVTALSLDANTDENVLYSTNIILIKKYVLENLITNAYTHNLHHFHKDVIMSNLNTLKIHAYQIDNFAESIDSLQSYYTVSMSMLQSKNRSKLFNSERPIYTKERDDMPARYGVDSAVKNALVADGCTVEGKIENCILFKGVTIGKGAVVKNSIIMQDTIVGENAKLSCVITDKNVVIKHNVELKGATNYPICLGKGSTV